MDILGIMGSMPGQVMATVAHLGVVRQVRMEINRNPSGGWHARRGEAMWGPRCHSATTAILLQAGEAWPELSPSDPPALELAAD